MQHFEDVWKTVLGDAAGERLREPRAVTTLSPAQGEEGFAGTSLTQSINNNMVCSAFKSDTFSLTISSSASTREQHQPRTIQLQVKSCLWQGQEHHAALLQLPRVSTAQRNSPWPLCQCC